jgi:Ribbon-helix-helix protein, copG family
MKRISVFLGGQQLKALERIAGKEGISVAELIRWAIERLRADNRSSSSLPLIPPKEKRSRRGRVPRQQKGGST